MAIFRWDDAQLTSLINLLAMRSSTELDPNMDGSLKDEDEVIEQTEDDAKTSSPALISGVDPGDVKRRFLDRLAEVLSKDKGGTHVSCAVLKEESGSITVFASRNSAFDKVDQRFCARFQELLMNISTFLKLGQFYSYDDYCFFTFEQVKILNPSNKNYGKRWSNTMNLVLNIILPDSGRI